MGQALRGRRGPHVVWGVGEDLQRGGWGLPGFAFSPPAPLARCSWQDGEGFRPTRRPLSACYYSSPVSVEKYRPLRGQGRCLRCCLSSDSSSSLETCYPGTPQLGREGETAQMCHKTKALWRQTRRRACVASCLVLWRGTGHKDWSIREGIKCACMHCICERVSPRNV